jgi:hypothetical protein
MMAIKIVRKLPTDNDMIRMDWLLWRVCLLLGKELGTDVLVGFDDIVGAGASDVDGQSDRTVNLAGGTIVQS